MSGTCDKRLWLETSPVRRIRASLLLLPNASTLATELRIWELGVSNGIWHLA